MACTTPQPRASEPLHLSLQEKWVEGMPKLYPTVRLQIVRDLYIREWQVRRCCPSPIPPRLHSVYGVHLGLLCQERTRKLGEELAPLYFPELGQVRLLLYI